MTGPASQALAVPRTVQGLLHLFVAFDWGDEIRLEQVRSLVPASVQELPRRRRTPPSFLYRPPPLRVSLPPVALKLDALPTAEAAVSTTLFDFGAVSVALRVPFDLP